LNLPQKISPISLGAKSTKTKSTKMKCKKDVYYIVPVLYTISAGDTSTYGKGSGAHRQKGKLSCGSSNLGVPDDVLPNAIQCTKVPSGTRLNIEALKNTGILSQILTEIIEKDGECKQKEKGRPSAFKRI
jgi:hypothetical protein